MLAPLQDIATANLLLASGGAIALGIVCVGVGLLVRMLETREHISAIDGMEQTRLEIGHALAESDALLDAFHRAERQAQSEHR